MAHDSRGPGLFMVCCFVSFAFFNFPPVLHSGQRVATLKYTLKRTRTQRDCETGTARSLITDQRQRHRQLGTGSAYSGAGGGAGAGRPSCTRQHAAAQHAAPPRGAQTPASALPLGKLFTHYDSMSYGNHSRNKGIKSRTRAPHTPDTRTRTHVTPNHQTLTVDA